MQLHYRTMGEGQPLVILHGLLGTSDNWQTLAKSFAQHYQVFLVDQRNHGRSAHSEELSYQHMADDLLRFLDKHRLQSPIIMGHSMGGKVAMRFALQHPERLSKLIVVDIAPKAYPVHHRQILDGLKSADIANAKSRSEIEEHLVAYIEETDVRQFLMKNLYRQDDGSFAWRMNLDAIDRNIEAMGEAIESASPCLRPTLFIRGGKSRYIKPDDYVLIEHLFPNVEIETIEEAGHWVHAEAPEEFYRLVMAFLQHSDSWQSS